MALRFVHTADWQLGRPFTRFADELAGRLRAARLDAIDRLAAAARAHGAAHVLVAGDVWDHETPSAATLRQPLDLMARANDLDWWLLPGNHDPARPDGLWQRLVRLGPPANVHLCVEPAPVPLTDDAWLLPAPLTAKRAEGDPTAAWDGLATPADAARIGLAHGAVADVADTGEAGALIAPDRATRAGLAYLALGDWHGRLEVDRRTWYAGTPEPDRFRANDPGWCLVVTVAGPAEPPRIEPVATARFRWREARLALVSGMDLEAVDRLARDDAVPASRTLARVTLAGSLGLAERAALGARLEALAHRLAHLEWRDDDLLTLAGAGDLDALGETGSLRAAAEALAARAADEPAARRALELLYGWATQP
ncbi:MAG: exonuclease SbcCD subunit D [Alphaproteobacteria bacterium]